MLLKMSISGGILIFFTIILRFFAINKLPKRVFMLLWNIILLRLLLPFNLPLNFGFKFSVLKIINYSTNFDILATPAMQTDTNEIAPTGTLSLYLNNIKWIAAVWAVGMTIFIVYFGVLYYKEYKKIQQALPMPEKTEKNLRALANIPDRVHIYTSDRIYTPLTFGILSPKIVLPKLMKLDNNTELKYVLTHELVHIKMADNLHKIIMLTTTCIHWFNPFVWIMYVFFNRDMELSCDEKVINSLGQECRKEYAMTLINLTEKQSNWALFSNGFGKGAIYERIEAIMEFKKISAASIICAVALTGMAITAFAQNSTESVKNNKYFSEYEEYGLSYDKSGKHLIFGEEIVGYFHDETSKGVYTHITDNAGTIGIVVSRNSEYTITGLEKVEIPEDMPVYEINGNDFADQMEELLESNEQMREYGYPVNTYSYKTKE